MGVVMRLSERIAVKEVFAVSQIYPPLTGSLGSAKSSVICPSST
jgi:hypothetical protein